MGAVCNLKNNLEGFLVLNHKQPKKILLSFYLQTTITGAYYAGVSAFYLLVWIFKTKWNSYL